MEMQEAEREETDKGRDIDLLCSLCSLFKDP